VVELKLQWEREEAAARPVVPLRAELEVPVIRITAALKVPLVVAAVVATTVEEAVDGILRISAETLENRWHPAAAVVRRSEVLVSVAIFRVQVLGQGLV
jgi:hypothetical protein